jgi:hypothetical protein
MSTYQMPSFTVNYSINSSADPKLFQTSGASHYVITVQALHQGAARDMVINMNGGPNNCRINIISPVM